MKNRETERRQEELCAWRPQKVSFAHGITAYGQGRGPATWVGDGRRRPRPAPVEGTAKARYWPAKRPALRVVTRLPHGEQASKKPAAGTRTKKLASGMWRRRDGEGTAKRQQRQLPGRCQACRNVLSARKIPTKRGSGLRVAGKDDQRRHRDGPGQPAQRRTQARRDRQRRKAR